MNFTVIFCCYVLAPYFASIVSPPQEAITCNAIPGLNCFGDHQSEKKKPEEKIEPVPKYVPTLEERHFQQKVDHYNFTDARKWEQLYLINDKHYGGNGIILLRIGTADEITSGEMQTGSWYEYCVEKRALCVGIVQRGYGKTIPNGDLKDKNLKYLTTDQALADMAWFIYSFRDYNKHLQSKLPIKLKWITYGNARQGTLAIFSRLKFPHLVHSTLAISAPVLAKEDFDDFFDLIDRDFLNVELELKNKIREAYTEIINQVNNRKYHSIGKLFNFCDEKLLKNDATNREKNIDFMYFTLAQTVALVMRYGKDDLKDIKNEVTDIMRGKNEKYKRPKERFAALISKGSRTDECKHFDYYRAGREYIAKIGSGFTSLDYPLPETFGERAEFYQSCNEFGHFETFNDFFGTKIGLEFYTGFCQAVFGDRFKNHLGTRLGVRRTNVFYGGLDIVVSNVIYVYADKDPLRKLGIINTRSGPTETHFVDAGHCEELNNFEKNPKSHNVKKRIFEKLTQWLDPEKYENVENLYLLYEALRQTHYRQQRKSHEQNYNLNPRTRSDDRLQRKSRQDNEKNYKKSNVNPRTIPDETENPDISETAIKTLTLVKTTNGGNNKYSKTDPHKIPPETESPDISETPEENSQVKPIVIPIGNESPDINEKTKRQ